MTVCFRLMTASDKQADLAGCIGVHNVGNTNADNYIVNPAEFFNIPGAPFAYWVSSDIRRAFKKNLPLESDHRSAKQGLATADDFRFLRVAWEVCSNGRWVGFAKGGSFSPFYADVYLVANWCNSGAEIHGNLNENGKVRSNIWMLKDTANIFFLRPGLTWPRRTNGLSFRILPAGCIFADKGPAIFEADDEPESLLALNALVNSRAFGYLVSMQLARTELAQSFEVGLIQQTPVPNLGETDKTKLAALAREAWALKRTLDTVNENSHAFLLPELLRLRLGDFNPQDLSDRMSVIQDNINKICFRLYGFSGEDQAAAMQQAGNNESVKLMAGDGDEAQAASISLTDGVLSWAAGVAFGRFDWRLATGEREKPADPDPFDSLPAQSPGMLPTKSAEFHPHQGILLDEAGHSLDLSVLIERVLHTVDAPVEIDVRGWMNKYFFQLHLKLYSKGRRQSPIYWPLQTPSRSHTLWVYYHRLDDQTLYTCVNDFVEPKLKQVERELNGLRGKSSRSTQEEKDLSQLTDIGDELRDFRDELLRIAKFWKPNLDDGVQITAAPLWKLFQHKAWQKKLKETWESLEKGDYDWADLACSIWPDRVLRKCHQDRSLAIAHDVEDVFWHEVEVRVKRGKKATGNTKLEWQPKALSDSELNALIQAKIKEMNA
ncbi:MAG: type II restriction endonuclease subunit M [Pseudomonadota bacterium]